MYFIAPTIYLLSIVNLILTKHQDLNQFAANYSNNHSYYEHTKSMKISFKNVHLNKSLQSQITTTKNFKTKVHIYCLPYGMSHFESTILYFNKESAEMAKIEKICINNNNNNKDNNNKDNNNNRNNKDNENRKNHNQPIGINCESTNYLVKSSWISIDLNKHENCVEIHYDRPMATTRQSYFISYRSAINIDEELDYSKLKTNGLLDGLMPLFPCSIHLKMFKLEDVVPSVHKIGNCRGHCIRHPKMDSTFTQRARLLGHLEACCGPSEIDIANDPSTAAYLYRITSCKCQA